MSRAVNHLHRYKKKNLGVDGKKFFVYACTKPACSHYIRCDLAEGKLCECNKCYETMLITKEVLTKNSGKPMTNPHCSDCTKRKKVVDEDVTAITEFLGGIESKVQVDERSVDIQSSETGVAEGTKV